MTPIWGVPVGGALYGPLALLQGGQPLRVLPLQGLQLLQLVRQRLQGGQTPRSAESLGQCRSAASCWCRRDTARHACSADPWHADHNSLGRPPAA